MLHRRVLSACTAALAVGALGLVGLPGTAAAQSPAPDPAPFSEAALTDVPSSMLKAMQRDLGLTADEAKESLVNSFRAGTTSGELEVSLGGSFAGSWVSGKTSGQLTVATTDAREAGEIRAAGARAEVVDHSMNELEKAKSSLDRVAVRDNPRHTPV